MWRGCRQCRSAVEGVGEVDLPSVSADPRRLRTAGELFGRRRWVRSGQGDPAQVKRSELEGQFWLPGRADAAVLGRLKSALAPPQNRVARSVDFVLARGRPAGLPDGTVVHKKALGEEGWDPSTASSRTTSGHQAEHAGLEEERGRRPYQSEPVLPGPARPRPHQPPRPLPVQRHRSQRRATPTSSRPRRTRGLTSGRVLSARSCAVCYSYPNW